MKIEDIVLCSGATVLDAMEQLDKTGMGVLFEAPEGILQGVLTDGDIRRYILAGKKLEEKVGGAVNYHPRWLPVEQRGKAKELMLQQCIKALPLLDKNGRIQDILFADGLDIDTRKQADLPVVMMAGGLGSRLYPYTKILPKPLIPVGDVPIAEHIINRFVDVGCRQFWLVVNYKKNMIKSYFNDLEKSYQVQYVDEDKPLGTGGGLSLLKGKVNSTFFLTNCDILIDADFGDVYQFHKKSGNWITMVCAVKHFTIPYGVIDLDEKGQIHQMKEKPEMNFLTNTGVYVVEPQVIDLIEPDTPTPFTDLIECVQQQGGSAGVYPVSEQSWMDMGQLEELDNMRRRLEQQ